MMPGAGRSHRGEPLPAEAEMARKIYQALDAESAMAERP